MFASLRAEQLRPAARPLSWGEWALGLALYGLALALCAGMMVAATSGAGLNSHLFSFLGGAR